MELFSALPSALMSKLLASCTVEDFLSLRCASKRCGEAVDAAGVWEHVSFKGCRHAIKFPAVRQLCSRAGTSLLSLDVSSLSGVDWLFPLVPPSPRLPAGPGKQRMQLLDEQLANLLALQGNNFGDAELPEFTLSDNAKPAPWDGARVRLPFSRDGNPELVEVVFNQADAVVSLRAAVALRKHAPSAFLRGLTVHACPWLLERFLYLFSGSIGISSLKITFFAGDYAVVEELVLVGNHAGRGQALAHFLSQKSSVVRLDASRLLLSNTSVVALLTALDANPASQVATLILDGNAVTDNGAETISSFLRNNRCPSLMHLSLRDNVTIRQNGRNALNQAAELRGGGFQLSL